MTTPMKPGPGFDKLVKILAALRSEGGCPWDRLQDEHSIAGYFLEEVYEAVDAVESGDARSLAEELGDVLLEVVFLARIFEEKGKFSVSDALDLINEKMIRRHPHVFGGAKARCASQVVDLWQKQKHREKKRTSLFEGMPRTSPALLEAFEIGQKVSGVGFDWKNAAEAFEKIKEETAEVEEALVSGDRDKAGREIGDLLFSVANVARHLGHNPELLLRRANRKFVGRFQAVEKELRKRGRDPYRAGLKDMDGIWNDVKRKKRKGIK